MTMNIHRPESGFSRRRFLATTSAAMASAAFLPFTATRSRAQETSTGGFRFVFMPCVHLRRDLRSPEGFASALQAVRTLSPEPDFILTGGDMCHNMRDQTLELSEEITDLFLTIYQDNCSLPAHHCLGNHDLAAWNKVAEAASDPRYGKNLTVQKFGMKDRHYSFDHQGWHFVVLDYLRVTEPGKFTADIDADQLAWLRDDLTRNKERPTIAVTHAPVTS